MLLKTIKKTTFVVLLFIIFTELILRYVFGFCNAPLYLEDPDFEYIYAPNQNHFRFRNIVKTNEASMRSEPISASDTTVILLIGDSVINGGNPTDHNELASTILEKKLTEKLKRKIRVLNISAGSWGPDNAFAFLKKKGTFNADLICLVASSHDAYDNMSFNKIVGIFPNYPNKQYKIAMYEFYDRYWWMVEYSTKSYFEEFLNWFRNKPMPIQSPKVAQIDTTIASSLSTNDIIHKFGTTFNKGFQQLYDTTTAMKIPFMIYLHPEIVEIEQRRYDKQGLEVIQFANQKKISMVLELEKHPNYALLYRDQVHYNAEGQRYLANQLYPIFVDYLNKTKKTN